MRNTCVSWQCGAINAMDQHCEANLVATTSSRSRWSVQLLALGESTKCACEHKLIVMCWMDTNTTTSGVSKCMPPRHRKSQQGQQQSQCVEGSFETQYPQNKPDQANQSGSDTADTPTHHLTHSTTSRPQHQNTHNTPTNTAQPTPRPCKTATHTSDITQKTQKQTLTPEHKNTWGTVTSPVALDIPEHEQNPNFGEVRVRGRIGRANLSELPGWFEVRFRGGCERFRVFLCSRESVQCSVKAAVTHDKKTI